MVSKDLIFREFKEKHNDQLSKLTSNDKVYLKKLLMTLLLEYRNKLKFNKNYGFGFEFEFDKSDNDSIDRELIRKGLSYAYKVKEEYTILDGGEIATPILHNVKKDWQNVKSVLETISKYAVNDDKCGGHIHIGNEIIKREPKSWENFFLLCSVYENILYRFLNGEFINIRESALEYAKPMAKIYEEILKSNKLKEIGSKQFSFLSLGLKRDSAINSVNTYGEHYYNTIEFRSANGTFNPVIWQNNLNMIMHLLLSVDNLDLDVILKRKALLQDNFACYENYSKINEEMALELVDLIFDNNLDKMYFLRQYFKNLTETSEKKLVKGGSFTR